MRTSLAAFLLGTLLLTSNLPAWPGKPPKDPAPALVLEYAYVSLGSFGGSLGGARALNNAGEVVGWSDLADGARHAFFYTDRFSDPGDFVLWDLNELIDEPGCVLTTAHGINSSGQIVGDADCNGALRGFVYSPPEVLAPGTPDEVVIPYSLAILEDAAAVETYADDINEAGDVVAQHLLAAGGAEFVVHTAGGLSVGTAVYRNAIGRPAAIDASGSFATGVASADPLIGSQALVFDFPALTPILLPLLGGPEPDYSNWSEANDINASGVVAGESTVGLIDTGKKGKNATQFGGTHAFRYSPVTGMQDLGTLDGLYSYGEAVNDQGDVAGRLFMGNGAYHAFVYTDADLDDDGEGEGMIDISPGILGLPAEIVDRYLEIEGMNDSLVICGWTGTAGPFLLVPVAP